MPSPTALAYPLPMRTLHLGTTCTQGGVLTLRDLPLHPGDTVEVVIFKRETSPADGAERHPLRGKPTTYLRPFDPAIPPEDSEANVS